MRIIYSTQLHSCVRVIISLVLCHLGNYIGHKLSSKGLQAEQG